MLGFDAGNFGDINGHGPFGQTRDQAGCSAPLSIPQRHCLARARTQDAQMLRRLGTQQYLPRR